MKIDNTLKPAENLGSTPLKGKVKTAVAQPTGRTPPSASAAPSAMLVSKLQEARGAMATQPVIDEARVQSIREAIRQGAFQVDTHRIADSLIDNVRQMLRSQK